MLDLTGILVSCLGIILVVSRAFKLDSREAWFQAIKDLVKPKNERDLPWRRRP